MTIVMVILTLFWITLFLLGLFLSVAFILLVVDAARNLREIRRQTKR